MDSCLKLVSCALGAILKWAHLHNKQFGEKALVQLTTSSFENEPCFGIQLNPARSQDWKLTFFATKEQFSCRRNPVFEICSNGFPHFKLSRLGCKSSSLVNGREKC